MRDILCNRADTMQSIVTIRPETKLLVTKSNDIDCVLGSANLSVSGGMRYEWAPAASLSNPYSYNPIVRTDTTTWFYVQSADSYGCRAKDSILVRVIRNANLNTYPLVNAFTPNGDGLNDCFGIKNWGYIKSMELAIYNRWGQQVFVTNNPGDCWNGKFNNADQPPGTFVVTIKAETLCGTVIKNGTLVLLR
ncbi:gliding motility-associated C-terminal domain-containing protein [Filimonas effusa]|uniref:Gliding motility-associated C-terminal domain-containing protein n=1 Tax=Filimonas effusa TaxID=2508721 RepID=A0A4Q1D6X3_9BACT|nr:gliding motility-associated C-terminal domain-containing protein [Filimonas effusa]RXK83786.1 gliding motility-associated C-terminal domain-containing protein [Filimonas effusa]